MFHLFFRRTAPSRSRRCGKRRRRKVILLEVGNQFGNILFIGKCSSSFLLKDEEPDFARQCMNATCFTVPRYPCQHSWALCIPSISPLPNVRSTPLLMTTQHFAILSNESFLTSVPSRPNCHMTNTSRTGPIQPLFPIPPFGKDGFVLETTNW